MSRVHIVGVDPGLVHTGVVRFVIEHGSIEVTSRVVPGPDPYETARWVDLVPRPKAQVFIEQYDQRQHYNSDVRMLQAEADFKRVMPEAVLLRNMGVNSIVTRPVLETLGAWRFPITTHHQDLRSAAKIAVLGMMKQEHTNLLLAAIIRDHIDGRPWKVTA